MDAELALEFAKKGQSTTFRCLGHAPPWKVVRGFPQATGECLVHLNNVSGGVFGGDCLRLSVQLRPGAEAQITTTGATRIYRPRSEAADATLISEFHLGENAVLEYLPDALIPFREARVLQRTSYLLEAGATLFYWESVAPGRAAANEIFQYKRLRLATEIRTTEGPVLDDRLLVEPARFAPSSPGNFGPFTHLVTFVALRAGYPHAETRQLEECLAAIVYDQVKESSVENANRESCWGVTTLPAHGVLVRGMLDSAISIPGTLNRLWAAAKSQLCNRVAIAPRKTY